MISKRTAKIVTALTAVLVAGTANAQVRTWKVGDALLVQSPSTVVTTAEGRRQLLERVEAAVARQCRDAGVRRKQAACEAQTFADLRAQAPAAASKALELALFEREGIRLASR